jgi:serine/threonine protein phosphatase PrpC
MSEAKGSARGRADTKPEEPVLFVQSALVEPVMLEAAGGRVAVYSRPAPYPDRVNEDSAVLIPLANAGALLVVADGVGGAREGARASRRMVTRLAAGLTRAAPNVAESSDPSIRSTTLDAVEETNRELLERGSGSTTLAIAELRDGQARPYHVGDSEIWLIGGGGKIRWRTTSHSPTGYAVEAGLLAESEALGHDERHLISNAVGASDMRVEIGSFQPMRPRDTLLVGTDGLFDNLRSREIVEIVRKGPLHVAARALARAAAERMTAHDETEPGKPDDLTFLLYRRLR